MNKRKFPGNFAPYNLVLLRKRRHCRLHQIILGESFGVLNFSWGDTVQFFGNGVCNPRGANGMWLVAQAPMNVVPQCGDEEALGLEVWVFGGTSLMSVAMWWIAISLLTPMKTHQRPRSVGCETATFDTTLGVCVCVLRGFLLLPRKWLPQVHPKTTTEVRGKSVYIKSLRRLQQKPCLLEHHLMIVGCDLPWAQGFLATLKEHKARHETQQGKGG